MKPSRMHGEKLPDSMNQSNPSTVRLILEHARPIPGVGCLFRAREDSDHPPPASLPRPTSIFRRSKTSDLPPAPSDHDPMNSFLRTKGVNHGSTNDDAIQRLHFLPLPGHFGHLAGHIRDQEIQFSGRHVLFLDQTGQIPRRKNHFADQLIAGADVRRIPRCRAAMNRSAEHCPARTKPIQPRAEQCSALRTGVHGEADPFGPWASHPPRHPGRYGLRSYPLT